MRTVTIGTATVPILTMNRHECIEWLSANTPFRWNDITASEAWSVQQLRRVVMTVAEVSA